MFKEVGSRSCHVVFRFSWLIDDTPSIDWMMDTPCTVIDGELRIYGYGELGVSFVFYPDRSSCVPTRHQVLDLEGTRTLGGGGAQA